METRGGRLGACAGSHQRSKLTNVPQVARSRFRRGLRVQAQPPTTSLTARKSPPKRASSSWKALARSLPARLRSCAIRAKLRRAPRVQAPCGTATGRGGAGRGGGASCRGTHRPCALTRLGQDERKQPRALRAADNVTPELTYPAKSRSAINAGPISSTAVGFSEYGSAPCAEARGRDHALSD